MEKSFRVKLEKPPTIGAWTYIVIPFNVKKTFGENGHVKVVGTINNIPFRTIISPRDEETHYMIINKTIREQAGVNAGDEVDVVISLDKEPRIVQIPDILRTELNKSEKAKEIFEKLSYTHQKTFAEWVVNAKKSTTIEKRAKKTIEMLLQGKTIK